MNRLAAWPAQTFSRLAGIVRPARTRAAPEPAFARPDRSADETPAPLAQNAADLPDFESGAPTSLTDVFRAAATFSAPAGLLGFLLSILVTKVVFDSWSLNFLQIASSSDVVMSGLYLGLPVLVTAISVFILLTLTDPRRRSGRDRATQVFHLLCVAGPVVMWAGLLFLDRPVGSVLSAYGPLALLGLVIVGYYRLMQRRMKGAAEKALKRGDLAAEERRASVMILLFMVVMGTPVLIFVQRQIDQLITEGYWGRPGYLVRSNVQTGSACKLKLYWIGERAMVVRCVTGRSPFFVIMKTESTVLEPATPDQDPRPGSLAPAAQVPALAGGH